MIHRYPGRILVVRRGDGGTRDVPAFRAEAGFSLIELMVVVLIIGILIAVALPIYLGVRTRAQDSAAKTDLRSSLVAGAAAYTASQSYAGFDAAAAAIEEPDFAWIDGGAPVAEQISIAVHTATDLVLVRKSLSGTFFCVAQVSGTPGTARGSGPSFTSVDSVAECTGGW